MDYAFGMTIIQGRGVDGTDITDEEIKKMTGGKPT